MSRPSLTQTATYDSGLESADAMAFEAACMNCSFSDMTTFTFKMREGSPGRVEKSVADSQVEACIDDAPQVEGDWL
eukprot:CAMPEP_0181217846 /NCGR_PEP_ID=MMETSP1096-20121128/27370_1 /TAXON_ID=156174 ORGANISM="Chrysochromulina ericina, Strain CCMP281" /NCGR_SAMPLE_ID=MMETSP1096 /ASSEMBLY_ACC=CAM_ASM_000453 /LENGTH=75 /DNA_ID=CAMNT_0023310007 /DNA_START=867 /DNA_END=1091 /DNA_ORIENTATION=+